MRLGIIGGGQLARMLGEAAERLGVSTKVLCRSADEPAPKAGLSYSLAESDFYTQCDRVVFENEFVDVPELRQMENKLEFFPRLDLMECLQDKIEQKKKLLELEIATSEFSEITDLDGSLGEELGVERVFKWAKYGYDGLGTHFFSADSSKNELKSFCDVAFERGARVFVEKKIDFKRELAVVGCRSSKGEAVHYPPVISYQEAGVCHHVVGPAESFGVSKEVCNKAEETILHFMEATQAVGCIAIEFFETNEGELLVNEIAPRVHNTGHFSLFASQASQFENHIRAVSDQALRSTESTRFFGMLNFLGTSGIQGTYDRLLDFSVPENLDFYWYDKSSLRPGRKMGHLNVKADTKEDFERNWQKALHWEQKFWQEGIQRR